MAVKNVALGAEIQDATVCTSFMEYIFSIWLAMLVASCDMSFNWL